MGLVCAVAMLSLQVRLNGSLFLPYHFVTLLTMSAPRLGVCFNPGCTLSGACKGLAIFFGNNSDLQTPCAACECIKALHLHDVSYQARLNRSF